MARLLAAALLLSACNLGSHVDLRDVERPGDGGDAGPEALHDADSRRDAETASLGPGPLTFVATVVELRTERMCDVDEDGVRDDAIADLGEPAATLMATTMSSMIAMAIDRGNRWLVHVPWVDDRDTLTDPEARMLTFVGLDEEGCAHVPNPTGESREDDFSGEEPYCAKLNDLDGCGETITPPAVASLNGGSFASTAERVDLGVEPPIAIHRGTVEGQISPGGASLTLELCGYAAASDLGSSDSDAVDGDLSLLEVMLAGGAFLGIPALPGLDLDVDVDGDGLERFGRNSDHRIEHCVDGDGSVIEGRDCWQDPRIADGLSLTISVESVSAIYQGREPGWDDRSCATTLAMTDHCFTGLCGDRPISHVCRENLDVYLTLAFCEDAHCLDRCGGTDRTHCRECAEVECRAELDACLEAPDCCPSPPETSAWDQT